MSIQVCRLGQLAVIPLLSLMSCLAFVDHSFAVADEPVGFDVVKRCVKESGGEEAFAKVNSIVMKCTIAVSHQSGATSDGLIAKGTLETYFVRPDRAKVVVDLGSFGKSVRGMRGDQSWETSDAGTRKLKSAEQQRLLDSISLRETFQPSSVFSSFTNRGRETVEGKPCFRVEVTRRGSNETDQIYFSIDDGLPLRTIAVRHTVGGDREIDSTIQQYGTFDGLKVATDIHQVMESFKMVHDIKVHTVEINGEIDDSIFTPPADLN
jgi:hypothetical protein